MNSVKEIYFKYCEYILRNLNLILLLILCLSFLFAIVSSSNLIGEREYQRDFRTYYLASKTQQAGLNPYDNAQVGSFNTTPYGIPGLTYAYHPYTLFYFQIFTIFPYTQALLIYMIYNLGLLGLLIYVWKRFFFPNWINLFLFLVVFLFAFNKPIFIALYLGGTSPLEAVIMWLALVAFIKNRPLIFLVLVSIISFFKGTPIVLAPMVFLLPAGTKNFRLFMTVLSIAFMIWLSPLLFEPQIFKSFWDFASRVREIGIINPCFKVLIVDLFERLGWNSGLSINLIYGSWVLILGLLYAYIIKRLDWASNRILVAFFTLLTYALIIPRFKDYAYIQLIPIAYFIIMKYPGLIFFNLFNQFREGITLPYFLDQYFPFYAAIINWGFLGYFLLNKGEKKNNSGIIPPSRWTQNKVLRGLLVLLVSFFTIYLISKAYQEIFRINSFMINRMKPLAISGVKTTESSCGAHETMMNLNYKGYPIEVNHVSYKKGIYAHAPSKLVFRLDKKYQTFKTAAGLIDTSEGKGSVKFKIIGDGKELFLSATIEGYQNPISIEVNVRDITELILIVDDLGNRDHDHAAWLNPVLIP